MDISRHNTTLCLTHGCRVSTENVAPAGSVKKIKKSFSSSSAAITDDDGGLQTFCACLEKILRHGIKGQSRSISLSKKSEHKKRDAGDHHLFVL